MIDPIPYETPAQRMLDPAERPIDAADVAKYAPPKERPILFSAPMVRALLAGTKTQTRRMVKPQPEARNTVFNPPDGEWAWWHKKLDAGHLHTGRAAIERLMEPLCPYGKPGDRLWVRETFAKIDGQTQPWIETDYRATYTHGDRLGDSLGIKKRWTPAIHMPRSASRITLKITAVRVERLQEISEADCRAEGIREHHLNGVRHWDNGTGVLMIGTGGVRIDHAYRSLWESINGAGSWDVNPWVWVIEFRRIP